ncbi:MAG: VCBS repeat-containing protein [Fuerstiella sp.]
MNLSLIASNSIPRIVLSCIAAFILPHTFNSSQAQEKEANQYAQFYGFSGVELYKLDERAFALSAGDFDSDGLTDILTVDNRTSCLRLFKQQKDAKADPARTGRMVNDLKSDWRFEVRQISVDKQIAGLICNDFNNDGRIDAAYIGTPDSLVIRYQPEAGKTEWSQKWSTRLPDLTPAAWMIASGDLNGDKRADIAVLGKNVTYIILQNEEGTMDAPLPLINTSSQLSLIQIADLDGDGRDDLSYQANEGSERGLCARLQTKDGRLGPEVRFDLNQPRSVTLYDVDQEPGKELLTVDSRTGRVQISRLTKIAQESGELPARLVQFGIGEASGSRDRAITIGDIDGDKLNDVVVTDPENAQVLVYRQNGIDGLDTAVTYPSLLGASDICSTDIDGDGKAEIVLMSSTESAVAVSQFQDGRMTFPQTVARPMDGFELAAIQCLPGESSSRLVVCQKKGSGNSAKVMLQYLKISADDDEWVEAAATQTLDAAAIGSRGVNLMTIAADKNGLRDLLVVPNGSGNKGVFRIPGMLDDKAAAATSEIKPLNLGTTSAGELFAKEGSLFVAREAFARKMVYKENSWTVADQFNAGESKARISGVAVLNLDDSDGDEVVLIDAGVKKLRILKEANGLYRPWKEVELGSLRFSSVHVADLNGDSKDDLLLFGQQQFAVLYSGRIDSNLQEIASYESDREDAYAADIIAGDLNGDSKVDLAIIDTSIDGIELLHFDADKGLKEATHFRVYEEKRLVTESNSRGTEPREGLVADVTDDGLADLIILCHDRLIVYPQDSGAPAEQSAETADSKLP